MLPIRIETMAKAIAAPRRRRAVAAVRRHYASRGGARGILGSFKPVLAGAIGGAAANLARGYNAQFGGVAALGAVGYFMKNETLMTMAGVELGHNVLGMTGLGGAQQSSNGGW